jgi:hypothetical protein
MPAPHIDDDLLDQYAIGTLSRESTHALEEHLLACSLCQSRLRQADEFRSVFSAAAAQVETSRLSGRIPAVLVRTGAWAGAAALVGAALFLISVAPEAPRSPAATVFLQALRGPDRAIVSAGKPVLLVFDVPATADAAKYEIEVVNPVGAEVLKTGAELKDGRVAGVLRNLRTGSYWVRVYRTESSRELVAEYGLRAE